MEDKELFDNIVDLATSHSFTLGVGIGWLTQPVPQTKWQKFRKTPQQYSKVLLVQILDFAAKNSTQESVTDSRNVMMQKVFEFCATVGIKVQVMFTRAVWLAKPPSNDSVPAVTAVVPAPTSKRVKRK